MQIKAVAAVVVVSETNPFLPPKIVNKSNIRRPRGQPESVQTNIVFVNGIWPFLNKLSTTNLLCKRWHTIYVNQSIYDHYL